MVYNSKCTQIVFVLIKIIFFIDKFSWFFSGLNFEDKKVLRIKIVQGNVEEQSLELYFRIT